MKTPFTPAHSSGMPSTEDEDSFQDIILRALAARDANKPSPFVNDTAYIGQSINNRSIDRLRSDYARKARERKAQSLKPNYIERSESPENPLIQQEQIELLLGAIDRMKDRCELALVAKVLAGEITVRDFAQDQGISRRSAYRRISNGLRLFRAILGVDYS